MVKQAVLYGAIFILYAGCTLDNNHMVTNTGGDDFPNAMVSLGKTVAEQFNTVSDWQEDLATPKSVPSVSQETDISLPTVNTTPSLSKSKATTADLAGIDTAYETIIWDDTASSGIITYIYTAFNDSLYITDTVVILYNEKVTDTIEDNEEYYSITGKITNLIDQSHQYFLYKDADGDSSLNNPDAAQNRVSALWRITSAEGIATTMDLIIDAGADNSIEGEDDNGYLRSEVLVSTGADTILYYAYVDADGDSLIYRENNPDSHIVDLIYIAKAGDDLSPFTRRASLRGRYVIFPTDTLKNYPTFWQFEEQKWSGRIITTTVSGTGADSTFSPGDTATAIIVVEPGQLDSIDADTALMTVLMGPSLNSDDDDSLISVYTHSKKRYGFQRETVFSFTSNYPIPPGGEPESGTVSYTLITEDEGQFSLKGTFDSVGIAATVCDSTGQCEDLTWDREGNVRE